MVSLAYHYHSDAVILDEMDAAVVNHLELCGRPGSRAPHIWLQHQDQRISILDLFGENFVVLVGTNQAAWHEAARRAACPFHINLEVYCIGGESQANPTDPENRFLSAYGIEEEGAVMVRPDGFVAWRIADILEQNYQSTLEVVLQKLLCRDDAAFPTDDEALIFP